MITIIFCNNTVTLEENVSINELLLKKNYTHKHFAVAINKTFIPQSEYSRTLLEHNDTVDIIFPMQGG